MTPRGTRAQTFTLEAVVAAILLVAAVGFALGAVSASTNTAGAAGAEPRGQHGGLAAGVLDRTAGDGELRATLLYWNESRGAFYGAEGDDGAYVSRAPDTAFGKAVDRPFDEPGVQYAVTLYYPDGDGGREAQPLVASGTPGDDAVRVVETVTLYDRTRLVDGNETARAGVTLESVEPSFYAPDAAEDSPLYTVVRVEVVVWGT